MTPEQLSALLIELLELSRETEWVEWKHNNADPEMIVKRLSSLSNSAALHGHEQGYMIWGIEDGTKEIVGTDFQPRRAKKGNQELESWLTQSLRPAIDFRIYEWTHHGIPMVLFEIPRASHAPVRFGDIAYIRIGSVTKKLTDSPDKERALWTALERKPFEMGIAMTNIAIPDVLALLDYDHALRMLNVPLPTDQRGILEKLAAERLIIPQPGGRYGITNLGAILFATDLGKFDRLERKALRIIKYQGSDKTNREREWQDAPSRMGYAASFEAAAAFIQSQLPHNEPIGQAFRAEVKMYPDIAIRELLANCLIHQDFSVTGAGPMVEIFIGRMEIMNPGKPLVDTWRFIGAAPQSRNETLAKMMRRMNLCEEAGSGIAKTVKAIEEYQLPAPNFEAITTTQTGFTKATLFASRKLSTMDSQERIRACYQHACLCYVSGGRMTNATLRVRFGIAAKNNSQASRLIKESLTAGVIKLHNPDARKRDRSYLPIWA